MLNAKSTYGYDRPIFFLFPYLETLSSFPSLLVGHLVFRLVDVFDDGVFGDDDEDGVTATAQLVHVRGTDCTL
jgi:hypothetical protein